MKIALAIYFGSFALAVGWFVWFAAIAADVIDVSGKINPWPLFVAAIAMIGAKFAIRSLAKKAEANG